MNKDKRQPTPASQTPSASMKLFQWLSADPANQEKLKQSAAKILKGECGDLPPEMLAPAKCLLETLQTLQSLEALRKQARSALDLMANPDTVTDDPIQLARAKMILDDMTDMLLGWREPYRTEILKLLHPVREKLTED